MIFKPGYLLVGLSIFLILAIVCTIVVAVSTPQKEHQVTEPVIMAIVEDSRMLQSLPQPASEPPIQTKPMPAKVSIPTDESIDEAIFIVSKTANANYENFVNAVPPNTAPSVPAAQNPATSVPAAQKPATSMPAATSVPAAQASASLSNVQVAQTALDAKNKLEKALAFSDPKASGPTVGKDIGGSDIGCYQDGSGPDFCANLCQKNSSCRGYNYVKPGIPGWPKGGCCYKKKGGLIGNNTVGVPLQNNPAVNYYTVTPSKDPGASAAQMGAQADIDLAAANAAKAKKAMEDAAAAAAKAAAAAAAAKIKKENDDRIAKTINGYRSYTDGTATKIPKQKIYDPNYLIEKSKFLYATGGDNDANGPALCSAKCNVDPTCRAFQYLTRPGDVNFKGTGGCQYFGHSGIGTYKPGMTTPITTVGVTSDTTADAYVIKPSASGTRAQMGFAQDIANVQKTIDMYKGFNNYTHPSYDRLSGKDRAGDDIGKIVGGSPDQCRIKCDADPSCQAFNYVRNTAPNNQSGTCYYKRSVLPISNNGQVDFFTKKPVPKVSAPMTGVAANAGTVVKK